MLGLTALNESNPQNIADAFRKIFCAGFETTKDKAEIPLGDLINKMIALINANSGSTAASRVATYGGTATAGDVLTLTLDGVAYKHTVVDGTSVTTAMTEMKDALNADEDFAKRYVASNTAGALTITAKRKGTAMNSATFAASKVGTGTFTAAGATFTGGAGLDDLLSVADPE